ncbi:MAG: DMT family transporter [Burkholderiaceae bacterium]
MSQPPGRPVSGTFAYFATTVCWGANIPLTTILFRSFDPFFLSLIRALLAAAVLGCGVILVFGWRQLTLPIALWRAALMSGAMAAFFVLYNLGLHFTNTITAAAIMAGAPVYAAVTMRLLTGMPLERGFLPAVALTVLGGSIAVLSRADGGPIALQGGEILIVLAFGCWTVYSLYAQRWFGSEVSQLRRTWVATLVAGLWLVPFWLLTRAIGLAPAPNLAPDAEALLWLGLTATFSSALGGLLWNVGVSRVGLTAGLLWQNMVPVFGVLISMMFGFVPTPGQILGGLLVICGVVLMQWRRFQAGR